MRPRPPHSALNGERLPGIGHNDGPPLDPNKTWRTHCWTKARKELLPRLPLEVIRRRVARARDLGLAYPAYASILLGTGRDIVAFLFTADGLGLRLNDRVDLPPAVHRRLDGLRDVDRLLGAPESRDPKALADMLSRTHGIETSGIAALPDDADAPWRDGREAIRSALAPMKLPSDTVVMIGTRASERAWADAANLARFLPADRYFETG